jgi:hypothetical protein
MKSRAAVAVLLSALVWPGAGQLYNREVVKGLAFIVVSAAAAVVLTAQVTAILVQGLSTDLSAMTLEETFALSARLRGSQALWASAAVLLAVWLGAVADAYRSARRRSG